jgi:photosystem II stability/assembly factor-like uncharacterized protein
LTGGAVTPDGRIVLVSQAGHVLVSSDSGSTFAPLAVDRPLPAAAVVALGANSIVVAGPRGVHASQLD